MICRSLLAVRLEKIRHPQSQKLQWKICCKGLETVEEFRFKGHYEWVYTVH